MTSTKVDQGFMRRLSMSLVQLADTSPDREVCGFLFDDGSFMQIPNVAPDPSRSFFMDPQIQLKAVQDFGGSIFGVFHSHPRGSPKPSPDDIAGWHPRMPWRYFIVTSIGTYEYARVGDQVDFVNFWARIGTWTR